LFHSVIETFFGYKESGHFLYFFQPLFIMGKRTRPPRPEPAPDDSMFRKADMDLNRMRFVSTMKPDLLGRLSVHMRTDLIRRYSLMVMATWHIQNNLLTSAELRNEISTLFPILKEDAVKMGYTSDQCEMYLSCHVGMTKPL
jgi:hypothetical protein